MSRLFALALIPLVAAVSCERKNSPGSSANGIEIGALPVHKPSSGGEMLLASAGEFTMGQKDGRPDERPHDVELASFYIDRYPVTQQLYEAIMGENPSQRKDPKSPVSSVYWTDAARFCNKCSEIEGLKPCYDLETWACDFEADGYRLPTEAEWEYACRAGTRTDYPFGNDPRDLPKYSWSKPHSRGRTHPVGGKRPNRWGLYDMHGNVWEWCNDWYRESYYDESTRENPRGPARGKMRVLRGGAWNSRADRCRSAHRAREYPVFVDACFGADSYGFRRVRNALQDVARRDRVRSAAPSAVDPPSVPPAPATPPDERPSTPPTPPPSAAPIDRDVAEKIDAERIKGTIVFVSDRAGALDIWKMHASGKDPVALTRDDHSDADPRFSPDGRKILYTTLRDGFPQVWIMSRDGSGRAKVTAGAQASWSPDGGSIVLVRDDEVWTREFDSGEERRITPASWVRCGTPEWSSNGTQIAVASRHERDVAIYLLGPDGKSPSRLVTEDACCTPDWSPDGRKLLFQTVKGHIHEIGADGRDEEPLTFGADLQHEARYSPDGSMAVFCRAPSPQGPWQICILDLESDDLDFVQITRQGSNRLPDWHALEVE